MAVSLSVLGSGSHGNCALVSSSRTRILVDAGLSSRETFKRMASSGEDPRSVTAILVSHEHNDHVSGLYGLARKLKVPVYLTEPTHRIWKRSVREQCPEVAELSTEYFHSGHTFEIGDISITPFTVPHDAVDPVGFTFRAEGVKLGLVTDLGYMPASVREHIRGCDLLMLESNHDLEMLRGGPYPWSVKQRVMSRVGHLSNAALGEFFAHDYDGCAAFLILAHLSEHNNHPEVARHAAEAALGGRSSLFDREPRQTRFWFAGMTNRLLLADQWQPLAAVVI